MTIKTVRKVILIDDKKCNGCGICIPSCAEGALQIVGGKAKLISEKYCDGLGACLAECPQGAIKIEDRAAEEFDEKAARQHQQASKQSFEKSEVSCPSSLIKDLDMNKDEKLPCGCASATVREFKNYEEAVGTHAHQPSQLHHWPVQLTLVPATAPFLKGADVVLAADCTAFAYAGFHRDFLKDHALLVACPKLDDFNAHLKKLTQVIANSELKSLTVVHMEVPCCSGLVLMARKALAASGNNISLKEITIGINGDIKSR
jgi:ferredoxin